MLILSVLFFFFFKQKTAYEMRISDWSSDVCSSDLHGFAADDHARVRVKHLVDARPSKSDNIWTVVDLFSGCGGMSAGFARRQSFRMLGAVDLEYGKPCAGAGALDCNQAYSTNIGVDRKSTRLNSSH